MLLLGPVLTSNYSQAKSNKNNKLWLSHPLSLSPLKVLIILKGFNLLKQMKQN